MAVPKLRFKADDGSDYPDLVEIKIGDAIKEAKRPLDMKDDEKYQLVTVKRRNEGIISRGMFYGRDILVKNYYTVKKGDYIISKRQVIHGANGIVPPELDDAIVSNEYMVLSDSSTLLVNYLALYSMTKKMYHMFYISSYGVDIEKMFFNVDDWKKKKIMVPCIKEQQKIVELFSLIDTVIEKQKETVSAWEERKKGVMQKLFGQEVRFKADDGSEFPEWEEKKLGDICKTFSGGTPKSGEARYYENGTISFIRSGEIHDDKTELRITNDGLNESSAKMVDVGDILYALYGATSGEVDISKIKGAINQAILCIRPLNDFNRKFIVEILRHNKETILRTYLQGGQGNLSAQIIQSLVFDFPCLAEQQKIADCLSSLDDVIEKQKATLAAWEEMKKGLLQQMFV